MHLPLDHVVEDVIDGRVRLAQAALRCAYGLQKQTQKHKTRVHSIEPREATPQRADLSLPTHSVAGLQSVPCHHLVDRRRDLARRYRLVAAAAARVEQPLRGAERLGFE